MVVRPEGDNAVRERLTGRLKNICRSYPAGGGVLSLYLESAPHDTSTEIFNVLQNADDAGASNVIFFLDEKTYPVEPLQHSYLARFQGPALLAYNSAIFTRKNLKSLSQLGESLKNEEGSSTGKFGLGFNSVYNYTDSPSILSDDFFTILDPHENWSSGGPRFNFVKDVNDHGMKNHMAAFQAIMQNPDKPFNGTIIRIPLRTKEQAIESDISNKSTTIQDMRTVLEQFADEFGKNGLLFMKNVDTITIRSTSGLFIEMSVVNKDEVRKHKMKVNKAVEMNTDNLSFEHSFDIILAMTGEPKDTKYRVCHSIRGDLMGTQMREWADNERLVPWVAVASPVDCPVGFKGSLFTVLPLPISMDQPVHIHGLFSLAPDRARLLTLEDKTIEDKNPAKYNEWLLQNPIPITWAKLLVSLACNQPTVGKSSSSSKFRHPVVDVFNAWPRTPSNTSDPLFLKTLTNVVGFIGKEKLPVWPTQDGYVPKTDYLMTAESTPSILQNAICEATRQVVFAPRRLVPSIRKLFPCHEAHQIIEQIIIPKWNEVGAANWSTAGKVQLATFVLAQYPQLSSYAKAALRNTPLVQVSSVSGMETSSFASPAELIDPANNALTGLFFAQEEVLPLATIFQAFSTELRQCGLKTELDRLLLSSRIRHYSKQAQKMLELEPRIRKLLSLPCPRSHSTSHETWISEMRSISWIPVMEGKKLALRPPSECRGSNDKLLISSQMSIYNNSISEEWVILLGWSEVLPSRLLVSQLRHGIKKQDHKIVNEVLHYMAEKKQPSEWQQDLQDVPFVLATGSGEFVSTKHVFSPARSTKAKCERLSPYHANVENGFWIEHQSILKHFKIGEGPTANDLLALLNTLQMKTVENNAPLDASDVAVAVEALRLASREPRELLRGIKIPNTEGYLCSIEKICHQDREDLDLTEKPDITHSTIPISTIRALGIESLNEWVVSGILKVEEDEELFDQHEETTTRIADTLRRYSINSTFREYLANADDTQSATKISWLLDQRIHDSETLVSKELNSYQGPALLVYNDGVFSPSDLQGFRKVGEGSKQKDCTTIGQFGRGSQTMYHWTDVPMLLSGHFLIILDPQQAVLPINRQTGKRKPGMKIPLSRVKLLPDQLAPFDGLWGFHRNMDYYPGTIFRFPLREGKSKSLLPTKSGPLGPDVVSRMLGEYFHEARKSLLFLKRIQSIEFKVQDNPNRGWSISRPTPQLMTCFTQVICSYTRQLGFKQHVFGSDEWWIATEDIDKQACDPDSRMVPKNTECSVGALVSSNCQSSSQHVKFPQPQQPGFFKTLPLQITSDLPVHINATFDLTGDRQSVILDTGGESESSQYNKHMLQEVIPKVYLGLMAHLLLGRLPNNEVFQFWPTQPKPRQSNCSDLIAAAFWERFAQHSNNLVLFPRASLVTGGGRRVPEPPLPLKDSVFDFLPEEQSVLLRPLLLSLGANVVQNVPEHVRQSLKSLPIQEVNGDFLRGLFRSGASTMCLRVEQAKKNSVLATLLKISVPDSPDQVGQLHGCYILPLLNGSFSKIEVKQEEQKKMRWKNEYYLVPETEVKLFSFASSLLVPPAFQKTFGHHLDTGKINIATVDPRNVEKLLVFREPPLTVSKDTDAWLESFWKFWNKFSKEASYGTDGDIENLGLVFKSNCNGIAGYNRFSELDSLPAIVEPAESEQHRLCKKIPGLFLFDPDLMHIQLKQRETSLSSDASFIRFIKSLRKLSTAGKHASVGDFLAVYLDENDLKLLRTLLTENINAADLGVLKADLRTIPLWPSWRKDNAALLASANALSAEDSRFLVPWMKSSSKFLDPDLPRTYTIFQNCLNFLGVETVSTLKLLSNYVLPLPLSMSETNQLAYLEFIHDVASIPHSDTIRDVLKGRPIAPDQNRNWHRAIDLYDHKDEIFSAAFRDQPDGRFLHGDVRDLRSFWLTLGLRNRRQGFFDAGDYEKCILSIARRLQSNQSDVYLPGDVKVVLSPLTTNSQATYRLSSTSWTVISTPKILPSRNSFDLEPEHRKTRMQQIALSKPLLSISEVVSYKYNSICWSQTAFTKDFHEPLENILGQVDRHQKGKPSLNLVWLHLKHLSQMASDLRQIHTRDFLKDLHATYTYLQDHLNYQSPRPASMNISTEPLWLNIISGPGEDAGLEAVTGSWVGITDLVLSSSCDAGRIQAIKPSLMQYEKLLRAMGCKFVVHPVVNLPEIQADHDLVRAFRDMRASGDGFDITFQSEGKEIRAHRLILAATSTKWRRQSYGHFPLEDTITFLEEEGETFISYHALSVMIDYAYGDKVDWAPMEVSEGERHDEDKKADKLNLLLDICQAAEFWLFNTLKVLAERKILTFGREFINIENVSVVLERAKEANTKKLEDMCTEFIEKNRETVEGAREQSEE